MHNVINPLRGRFVHGKDETDYFESVIANVNTGQDHTFIFSVWNEPLTEVPKNSILFSTSDEHHQQPIANHLHENLALIFKHYFPRAPICDNRVHPFPLGYLTDFGGHGHTPLAERALDYSFSGTANDNGRDKMKSALERRSKDGKNKYWKIHHDGWGKGLKMWDYGSLLTKTRIALCPPGYTSHESFRIFEAARCGCVLLVGDKLPTHLWYYEGFPGIRVSDWSNLSIIDELLSDPVKLQKIGDRTLEWYNRCVDPKAVGKYVTEKIKSAGIVE